MTDNTVFARCVALNASSRLNERQISWTGRWSLMGDFVVCTQCLAAQAVDLAHEPFSHAAGCVARKYGLHPWQELQQLLCQIPALSRVQLH